MLARGDASDTLTDREDPQLREGLVEGVHEDDGVMIERLRAGNIGDRVGPTLR